MPNAANRIFGSIDGNFDRSAGPINTTREEIYSQHAIYMPYTSADGLWCTAVEGDYRAVPHHFFRCPRGAELCGPEFTPDGETLFVSVQHPADELGSTYAKPSTRWPDFKDGFPPRPGIVAITKEGGGMIGD